MTRSQAVQWKEMLPATKHTTNNFPNFINNRVGVGTRNNKVWNRGMLLANRPYVNGYQTLNSKQLSYLRQNYWPRKSYHSRLWKNVPIDDVPVSLYYYPTVAPSYSLWGNARSRHVLQDAASFRSKIDEDQTLVEQRIQEYYDQRLNKNRNKWMFKPIQGTTPHLKEIFIGRCWDFVANRGKYLQNPSKVDCQELWRAFFRSFAFRGPCEATSDDYAHFFDMYEEKPLTDRVLFWSGTRELTHTYSRLYDKFTTLEDTLAGFLMNGLIWCGSKKGSGMDFNSCPYECSKQKPFWGQAAEKLAKRARGVVHVMLNGTRQHFLDKQIFPSFMDDSYLAENQLSSLPVRDVTEFRILVGHTLHHKSLERCDNLTVLELQNRAKARGLKTTCFDNPYFIRHLLCLENPADPLCLFKINDQNTMIK